MNKINTLFLLIGLSGIASHSCAQTLDPLVIKKYSPGAVARLFAVTKNIGLSPAQQETLAAWYQQNDSTAKDWLMQNKPAEEIDSLLASDNQFVLNLLGKDQALVYSRNAGAGFANFAGEGELQYMREEYKPDSANYRLMRSVIMDRYATAYTRYLQRNDGKKMQSFAKTTARVLDMYQFFPGLYSGKYINDYLDRLSSIKALPDTTLQHIRNFFVATINKDKYADWGRAANNAAQYFLQDTAIFSKLFHSDFEKQAYELTAADSYNLIYMEGVSANAYDSVYHLVKEKNYRKAVLQYTYAWYHFHTFDSLVRQTNRYYDSAIKASLLLDGSLQPVNQFAMALKYKNLLKLDPSLTDSLLYYALYLSRQRDSILQITPYADVDFSPFESEHLSRLLTDEQYTKLLVYKNRYQAYTDAQSDWAEMELRGLSGGFDKHQVINQITDYYVIKYSIWNRLAFDKIRQWANIWSIQENKPEALKVLDPVRWNGSTVKTNNNLKLQW